MEATTSAVAEKLKLDREHCCWTAEYLLGHCRGYRVVSDEGTLGYVEEVVWPRGRHDDAGEPTALRVRTRFANKRGLITILLEDVLELHPHGQWIVVRAPLPGAELPATDRGVGAIPASGH